MFFETFLLAVANELALHHHIAREHASRLAGFGAQAIAINWTAIGLTSSAIIDDEECEAELWLAWVDTVIDGAMKTITGIGAPDQITDFLARYPASVSAIWLNLTRLAVTVRERARVNGVELAENVWRPDLTPQQIAATHQQMQTPEFQAKVKRLHERGRKHERLEADKIATELGVPVEIIIGAMAYLLAKHGIHARPKGRSN